MDAEAETRGASWTLSAQPVPYRRRRVRHAPVDADKEQTIHASLAEDPWPEDLLTIESIRPCSVWLRHSRAA